MELKHLNTFYIMSKELNFTKAAEILGYTQACVSLHIQSLETELNARLFNRIGKSVTLTDVGEKLVPYAIKIINTEKEIQFLGAESPSKGLIRIGICDSLCINRLPNIIRLFKQSYPDIEIHLTILKCSEFYNELAQNEIDMAFTIGHLNKDNNIKYEAEKDEHIVVLCSPLNPLSQLKNVTLNDFRDVPILFTEKAAYYRQHFEQELTSHGITPNIILETESIQAIKNLTQTDLGICILPYTAAEQEIKNGQLAIVDYKCNYHIQSQIIWHKDKWFTKPQNDFIKIAKEYIESI